jgi:hypothetical protein
MDGKLMGLGLNLCYYLTLNPSPFHMDPGDVVEFFHLFFL